MNTAAGASAWARVLDAAPMVRKMKDMAIVVKKEKRSKVKDESESDVVPERKERKRPPKDSDPVRAVKLKDVTNSPRRRRAPPLTDTTSESEST